MIWPVGGGMCLAIRWIEGEETREFHGPSKDILCRQKLRASLNDDYRNELIFLKKYIARLPC